MSNVIVVDRSRIEAHEHCRRRRYWQYEWQGRGLESTRPSAALEIGKAVHTGLAGLLADISIVDEAVGLALHEFRQNTAIYNIQGQPEDTGEAAALVEALVRAWAAVRLPAWLDEYDVLNVEREELLPLDVGMVLLTRADALVRRKGDGSLFLVNFKTAKQIDVVWREQWRLDMQTLSEVLPVEARLCMEHPFVAAEKLAGVIIEGLVKGGKSKDGSISYQSPLTWPWAQQAIPGAIYKGRYEWESIDLDGSRRNRRLGRDWKRVPIWKESGGVKGWIEELLRTDRALVEEQFVTLPPILRSEWEIEEWKRATVVSEQSIRGCTIQLETDPELLPVLFQRHTSHGNCLRPSKCACYELCWGTAAADPVGSGLYRLRTPNHEYERNLLSEQTLTEDVLKAAHETYDGEHNH
jgi:hypothetical protein